MANITHQPAYQPTKIGFGLVKNVYKNAFDVLRQNLTYDWLKDDFLTWHLTPPPLLPRTVHASAHSPQYVTSLFKIDESSLAVWIH